MTSLAKLIREKRSLSWK